MGFPLFTLHSVLSVTCGPQNPTGVQWDISAQKYVANNFAHYAFDGDVSHVNLTNDSHSVRGWVLDGYGCDKAIDKYCSVSADSDCGHFTQLTVPTGVPRVTWKHDVFYNIESYADNVCIEIADLSHYEENQAITEIVINDTPFVTNLGDAAGRTVCLTYKPALSANVTFVVSGEGSASTSNLKYLFLGIRHISFSLQVPLPHSPPSIPPVPPLYSLTCEQTKRVYREVCCGADDGTISGLYAVESN